MHKNKNAELTQRVTIVLLTMLAVISLFLLFSTPVFAADIWTGDGWDMTAMRDRFMHLFNLFKSLAAPFAVLTLAISALQVIFGNEQEQMKALNRMKYALIAIATLCLLPAFISLGYEAVKDIAWDPMNPDVKFT